MPPHPNLREWMIPVQAGVTADAVARHEITTTGMPTGNEHVAIYDQAKPDVVLIATTDMPNTCLLTFSNIDANSSFSISG
jgi:hypothetical protein